MKILVGYDGSNVAQAALKQAAQAAQAHNAGVIVATSMVGGRDVSREEFDQAEKGLEKAEEFFRDNEIPCESHLLVRGLEPGEDLVQFALEQKVDRIIIGVRRRSKVGKLLFGSTAQYVILNAECPVLTIK